MSFSSCVKPFPQLYLYPSCFHSHVSGTTTSSSLSLPPRSSLVLKQNTIFHSEPKLQLKRASTTIRSLTPELKTTLDKVVTTNKIVLFMKGTKDFPQCGFSNTVVQILKSLNAQFETVNILDNDLVRQGLKEYSNWPTFPQLYIDGEFFGGCDITVEAYKNGELQELVEKAMCS
ncbi:unnamed protein product [Trifolium pratense]|uniref:Uncharacterized protein n=1 Tax=Trifolium pratense TaxID=57577 RepID=A0ACB0JNL2_TRIPR|nr:unnamed protein product [Trifolium pratense]